MGFIPGKSVVCVTQRWGLYQVSQCHSEMGFIPGESVVSVDQRWGLYQVSVLSVLHSKSVINVT